MSPNISKNNLVSAAMSCSIVYHIIQKAIL